MKKSYLTLGILATVLSSKVIMATNDDGLNGPNRGSGHYENAVADTPHDNPLHPNTAALPDDGGLLSYLSPTTAAVAVLILGAYRICDWLNTPIKWGANLR